MKNFYYTKTQQLIDEIGQIESLRSQLLLTVMSPRQELELRWEGIIDQIYFVLLLNGTVIPKEKIFELLSPQGKKILNPQEKLVIGCKKTLDYLYHNWLVNDQPISVQTLQTILNFFDLQKLKTSEAELTQILNYSQLNTEHCVIQASVAYIYFYDLYHSNHELNIVSSLFYIALLYKQGYDFRGMISVEEHFINDSMNFQIIIANGIQLQNITSWLEYFAHAVNVVLKEKLAQIQLLKQQKPATHSSLNLNDRQKGILNILNNPNIRITNSQVQKQFKVSQITASRDLAKLTALGILLSMGKGRSTQYSKV